MKILFNSFIFPLILLIILFIFTWWINKLTHNDDSNRKKTAPITIMYGATIQSYNQLGKLENSVEADKIIQNGNSNSYNLYDANIKRYKDGKMIQNILGHQANYNAETKDITISGSYKQQTGNRLEIIINEF